MMAGQLEVILTETIKIISINNYSSQLFLVARNSFLWLTTSKCIERC